MYRTGPDNNVGPNERPGHNPIARTCSRRILALDDASTGPNWRLEGIIGRLDVKGSRESRAGGTSGARSGGIESIEPDLTLVAADASQLAMTARPCGPDVALPAACRSDPR